MRGNKLSTVTETKQHIATDLDVTLTVGIAKTIASFAVFTDAKSVTPALQQVKLVFTTNQLEVIATDRYVASKGVYAWDTVALGAIYLDPATCKFIAGIKSKLGLVNFKLVDGKLTVTDYTASHTSSMFTGNYPAVETLIDGFKPGSITEATLTIDLLAKLGKVINIGGAKAKVWQFTAGDNTLNPNRPVPIMAKQAGVEVIIQPNYPGKGI
jgi:hypothetical protein